MPNNGNSRNGLSNTDAPFTDEILKLAQCLMPEPPTAKVKQLVAAVAEKGIDRQIHEMGWKAYDTVVGAAHQTTSRLFTTPAVGQVIGTAIDITLRWQRFNAAVAGAFFAALWPSVGLPSANEVEGLRSDVRAMREELRDAIAERDEKEDFVSELHVAVRESIVSQPAPEKLVARQSNGHTGPAVDGAAIAAVKKPHVQQFAVWSGWLSDQEHGEDVGN